MYFVWRVCHGLTDRCVQEAIFSQLSRDLLQMVGLIYV